MARGEGTGKLRVYIDTSVFGGAFDDEFAASSLEFLNQVREGRFVPVVSVIVEDELVAAPERVRTIFQEIARFADAVAPSEDAAALAQAYIDAGIVGERRLADALHVALATVSGCFAIVSWNFRHMVHLQKIPLYNAVNALHRYSAISIGTPAEVVEYEPEEDI